MTTNSVIRLILGIAVIPIIGWLVFIANFDLFQADDNKTIDGEKEQLLKNELNGVWYLPAYLDSVITNKSISSYRMIEPSYFGILLVIRGDTIKNFGSIFRGEQELSTDSGTLAKFRSENWVLSYKAGDLLVVSEEGKEYRYKKKDQLSTLVDTSQFKSFSEAITDHFHKGLFLGKYENLRNEKEVTFGRAEMDGFNEFIGYEVKNYFGTHHSFENMDLLKFKRDTTGDENEPPHEWYKWNFQGDTLFLTGFDWEMTTHRGKTVRKERGWTLKRDSIPLLKKD